MNLTWEVAFENVLGREFWMPPGVVGGPCRVSFAGCMRQ